MLQPPPTGPPRSIRNRRCCRRHHPVPPPAGVRPCYQPLLPPPPGVAGRKTGATACAGAPRRPPRSFPAPPLPPKRILAAGRMQLQGWAREATSRRVPYRQRAK